MTFFRGDYARTERLAQESLELARAIGDPRGAAFSLFILANVRLELGDGERASALCAECEAAALATDEGWYHAIPLLMQSLLAVRVGDLERAIDRLERSVKLDRESGDKWAIGMAVGNLAGLRLLQDRRDEAAALSAEGIRLCEELADRRGLAWFLAVAAAVAATQERFMRAARMWGAAEAFLEGIGSALPTQLFDLVVGPALAITRESLGAENFRAAWSEGRAMSFHQAVQYALERSGHAESPGSSKHGALGDDQTSPSVGA
jgi:non-specific serine/threonine protein kinase